MSAAPVVSIVIPVWNRSDTLGRAIASVLAQTDPDFEVVVLDNGSDEPATVAEVVAAANDDRVRLVRSEVNLGPSGGRNHGVEHSRGRFVGFLDSDDELEPEWVERMTAPFDDPSVLVATCGLRRIDPEGVASEPRLPSALGPAHGGVVACFQAGTMLVRRAALGAIGGYDERFWFGENTDLGLRMCQYVRGAAGRVGVVPAALLRWHDDGAVRRYSRPKLEAAELMLEVHAGAMAEDRFMRESHLAVAGVQAARLGDNRRARRHFRALFRSRPGPKALGRYLLTWAPPLARRVWGHA